MINFINLPACEFLGVLSKGMKLIQPNCEWDQYPMCPLVW